MIVTRGGYAVDEKCELVVVRFKWSAGMHWVGQLPWMTVCRSRVAALSFSVTVTSEMITASEAVSLLGPC